MEVLDPIFPPLSKEVHLPKAPLIAVVCQVRFESILSIQKEEGVAPFQEAIRERYPILKIERGTTTLVEPTSLGMSVSKQTVWRFSEHEGTWKVSLAENFLALETTRYESRHEFITRFSFLLEAFAKCFNPNVSGRIGMRYIDRLSGEAFDNIEGLVRGELLGVLTSELVKPVIAASFSEAFFNLKPHQLFARWGRLPAGATTDPAVVAPINSHSWILDIDAFTVGKRAWNTESILDEMGSLADVAYRFFRWAVKEEFLTFFGGTP